MKTADVVAALETFDRRLVSIESDMADAAAFGDEHSKQLEKLTELHLAMSRSIDELKGMLGNYVDATRELRETTRALHSEVRAKLKVAGA